MINMLPLLQAGEHPVRTLLVTRGYAISALLLFSMVYLRYETKQRFRKWVYIAFGGIISAMFLFSTGTIWFEYPAPGVIWSIALTLVAFFSALAVAFVAFGPEDVFIQHHRELHIETDGGDSGQENEETPDTGTGTGTDDDSASEANPENRQ